jgi:hypothetical protein
MATSNFHNVNATHIFAVQLEDEWAYDDLVENLESEFSKHSDYYDYGKSDPNELRSFPSKSLGSFSNSVVVGEDEVEIYITPVIRSGYYEGVNLDWHCSFEEYGESIEHLLPQAEEEKNRLVEMVEYVFSEFSTPLGVTAQFSNGETIYHPINYQK